MISLCKNLHAASSQYTKYLVKKILKFAKFFWAKIRKTSKIGTFQPSTLHNSFYLHWIHLNPYTPETSIALLMKTLNGFSLNAFRFWDIARSMHRPRGWTAKKYVITRNLKSGHLLNILVLVWLSPANNSIPRDCIWDLTALHYQWYGEGWFIDLGSCVWGQNQRSPSWQILDSFEISNGLKRNRP